MSCEEELEERFANMDILELEDIVRNKKNEYTEEAYSTAVKQFQKRYNENPNIILQSSVEKEAQDLLDEIDKKRNPSLKWYCFLIYFWIPLCVVNGLGSVSTVHQSNAGTPVVYMLVALEISLALLSEIFIVKKKRVGLWFFLAFLSFDWFCFLVSGQMTSVFSIAIFTVLNTLYFYKRKHLFK